MVSPNEQLPKAGSEPVPHVADNSFPSMTPPEGVPPSYEHPHVNSDASRRKPDGSSKQLNKPDALETEESERLSQFRQLVRSRADIYLQSFPGKPNVPSNIRLEAYIRNIKGSDLANYKQLNTVLTEIEYRMDLMEHANRLAAYLGVRVPLPRCQNIDMDLWDRENSTSQVAYAQQQISAKSIFGKPSVLQGPEYMKPIMYLAACMKDWDNLRIDKTLSLLVTVREGSIADLQSLAESIKEVEIKQELN
ncbi:hypothetical protein VTL71DRAFT_6927 [Oculimacula yallundae]|uniref:Uncharacterized protein n=1 Tax=Oculimacula yallundae TaxID=86028 RepID=A0ABR4BV85_9HELO